MHMKSKILCLVCLTVFLAANVNGATIAGTVNGPDGAPFKGAFVEAQNQQSRVTYNVLTNANGKYHMENVPAGDYKLMLRAPGYKADPQSGITLTADQNASYNFSLQKGMVRWTDLSIDQGKALLPDGAGKAKLTTTCFACHGFQSRMASAVRDESGWRDRVNFMRANFGYLLNGFTDKDEDNVVAYLTTEFGPDSNLPKSPADLPQYQELKKTFSDDAMRIVYVTYEMPGSNRFPGAAKPEIDGNVWIWTYNQARFAKLDPKTAKVTEYQIPDVQQASNHSVVVSPVDKSVWFTEQAENVIGRLDPKTDKITRYRDNVPGNRHTMVIDSKGTVYVTGNPLARFDPETEKFTNYDEVPSAYGVVLDSQDNAYFSEFKKGGKIGKIDAKTGKITKYTLPTDGYPRRMHFDPSGMLWICEYQAGKIARFDPKTEQFKEYDLPGEAPTPYAMNIDKNNHIWYSSMDMDIIGELDPSTGKVTEYPFVYAENGMRDFFMDANGNMWWGSQPNNHVGYFYLAAARPGDRASSTDSKPSNDKSNDGASKAKPKDRAPATVIQE